MHSHWFIMCMLFDMPIVMQIWCHTFMPCVHLLTAWICRLLIAWSITNNCSAFADVGTISYCILCFMHYLINFDRRYTVGVEEMPGDMCYNPLCCLWRPHNVVAPRLMWFCLWVPHCKYCCCSLLHYMRHEVITEFWIIYHFIHI